MLGLGFVKESMKMREGVLEFELERSCERVERANEREVKKGEIRA